MAIHVQIATWFTSMSMSTCWIIERINKQTLPPPLKRRVRYYRANKNVFSRRMKAARWSLDWGQSPEDCSRQTDQQWQLAAIRVESATWYVQLISLSGTKMSLAGQWDALNGKVLRWPDHSDIGRRWRPAWTSHDLMCRTSGASHAAAVSVHDQTWPCRRWHSFSFLSGNSFRFIRQWRLRSLVNNSSHQKSVSCHRAKTVELQSILYYIHKHDLLHKTEKNYSDMYNSSIKWTINIQNEEPLTRPSHLLCQINFGLIRAKNAYLGPLFK